MRKISVFIMTSLDGYFARPNGDIDWHVTDDEFNEFAIQQLDSVDAILFGRVTYEGMASYWPTPIAAANDPDITEKMNTTPKIVFSRTLASADWQNTRLIKDNVAEEVTKLKQQPGKDLIVFGSSNLSASFLNLGLIDELRIMVNPVAIGSGQTLFGGLHDTQRLNLLKSRVFKSGNMLLYYQPETK